MGKPKQKYLIVSRDYRDSSRWAVKLGYLRKGNGDFKTWYVRKILGSFTDLAIAIRTQESLVSKTGYIPAYGVYTGNIFNPVHLNTEVFKQSVSGCQTY